MLPAASRRVALLVATTLVAAACGGDAPTTPAPPSELGSFSVTVTGALNATTHLSALPLLDSVNSQHNFIGMNSAQTSQGFYAITVLKASSGLGPPDGYDNVVVTVNPLITAAGVYHNNSCTARTGGPAACVGVDYSISTLLQNQIATNRGSLNNLQDDRDVVTIDQIDPARIRLSITGPFVWTRTSSTGAPLRDTVVVTASFDAYQMHR